MESFYTNLMSVPRATCIQFTQRFERYHSWCSGIGLRCSGIGLRPLCHDKSSAIPMVNWPIRLEIAMQVYKSSDNLPTEVPTILDASRLGMVEASYTTQYCCYDIYQTEGHSSWYNLYL